MKYMQKSFYISYDEGADELIVTTDPKAKTVGYFVDSGTALLLGMKNLRPYGFSILLLKEFFKKHKRQAFTKVPLEGNIELPMAIRKQLSQKGA